MVGTMESEPQTIMALKALIEGNRRFASGCPLHPNQAAERRMDLAERQEPIAVVVGCSDSRVPPEILFDQGIGDLFVIRTAGHVVDDVTLASIEYAVAHLRVRLVLVLGHTNCGAVGAVVRGETLSSCTSALAEEILPAAEQARGLLGSTVDEAARIHARRVAARLRRSLADLRSPEGTLRVDVLPAFYDLVSGRADVLDEPSL